MPIRVAGTLLACCAMRLVSANADEPEQAKERERQVVEWCAGYWESDAYHSQDTHKGDLCFLAAMHTDVSPSTRLAIRAAFSAVAVPNDTLALLRIAG